MGAVFSMVRRIGRPIVACAWAAAYGLMKPLPPPVILSDQIKQRTIRKSA